MHKGEM